MVWEDKLLEMMIPGQHDCRHNQDDSHLQLADIYQATHHRPDWSLIWSQ